MTKKDLQIINKMEEALKNAAVAINFKKAASQEDKYKIYQRDILDSLSKERVERAYKKLRNIHHLK